MEAAGRNALDAGIGHGHHGAAFHVSHADPRLDQRVLEGEAAAEKERHEVVPPEVPDVVPLLGQLALAVDAVAGDIGAKIRTRGRADGLGIARWSDLDDRTGRGIAGTEGGELDGRLLGEDHHVCLLVGRAMPGGGTAPFAAARGGSELGGGGRYSHFTSSGRRSAGWCRTPVPTPRPGGRGSGARGPRRGRSGTRRTSRSRDRNAPSR